MQHIDNQYVALLVGLALVVGLLFGVGVALYGGMVASSLVTTVGILIGAISAHYFTETFKYLED